MNDQLHTCQKCGRKFSKYAIKNHLRWHEENPDRLYPLYTPPKDLHCPYCGSLRRDFRSWSQHKRRCTENPEFTAKKLERNPEIRYKRPEFDTSRFDPSIFVCQYCGTSTTTIGDRFKNHQSCILHESVCRYNPKNILIRPDYVSDLEKELDDDGKLFTKWSQKKSNAKTMKNECFLTFDDFCHLVKEAGLVSSQLGLNGEGYDLARYGDTGPYEIGNCRFITHRDNNLEKASYIASQERKKQLEQVKSEQQELRKIRHQQHVEREKIRRSNIDPRRSEATSGIHNSSFGSHWITNGTESRKWRPWKEELPSGWRLGRVVSRRT